MAIFQIRFHAQDWTYGVWTDSGGKITSSPMPRNRDLDCKQMQLTRSRLYCGTIL